MRAPSSLAFGFCIAALVMAAPAHAATIMIHGAGGSDCYRATMLSDTPANNKRGVEACTEAFNGSEERSYDRVAALVNRADIYLRLQDYASAVADSDKALAIDSGEPGAYINRGAAKVGLTQYQDAIADLNRAIELRGSPLHVAYYNRALAKDYLGDARGAYLDYRQSVTVNPEFTPATVQLARFQVKLRQP